MSDIFEFPTGELPDDLKSLDEELSSIRYEERASFVPELRAELARAWEEEPARRRAARRRHLTAAATVALLLGGASVPSARASLVRLIEVFTPAPIEAPVVDVTPMSLSEPAPDVELPGEPVPATAPPDLTSVAEAVPVSESEVDRPVAARIAPQMLDRAEAEALLREAYPDALQLGGIGGEVRLRMDIDETGRVLRASVAESSGVEELDRVAVEVAPRFRFVPAVQAGEAIRMSIEFPVRFEPEPLPELGRSLEPVVDPLSLPTVVPSEWWQLTEPLDPSALSGSDGLETIHVEEARASERSLTESIGDAELLATYGPASAILDGTAPPSVNPMEWREAVGDALAAAVEDGRATAASFLALGRIRMRQGVRADARRLLERGLQMAVRDRETVTPWVVAELHHERGSLLRETWRASRDVGRVRADAFVGATCPGARSSGGGSAGFASVERVIAWNYLCPAELGAIFEEGFEARDMGSAELTLMTASYRAAIEAYPPHAGANVDLLLTLAAEGRWTDVLHGARRFVRVSGGHVDGLLLTAMALHRLGRTEEAEPLFRAALERMDPSRADRLSSVAVLLEADDLARYRQLPLEERRVWEDDYWASRDRVRATGVNERRVEHLARTAYAELVLGSVFGDAGEVWIRFGAPDGVHVVDGGSGRLTEFWDYGSGPDITFVRWISSDRRDLTPEGRAFVDDLGRMFVPE